MQRIQTQNSGRTTSGFPSLGTVGVLGWITLLGGHPMHCGVSCSILGLDANSTHSQPKRQPKMTPVIVRCLCGVGGDSSPTENS